MKPKTLAALKASITKWETLIVTGEEAGAIDCPLCIMFNNERTERLEKDCIGCPVFEKTGKKFCTGTPYGRHAAVPYFGLGGEYDAQRRRHALSEMRFLRSLLP